MKLKTDNYKRIKKAKSWFLERINKIDNFLVRKREREKGEGGHYIMHINLLNRMDQFLERHRSPKFTQEEIDNLNNPTTILETSMQLITLINLKKIISLAMNSQKLKYLLKMV